MRLFINEFARAWKNPRIPGAVIIACLAAVLGLKITAGDGTFFYTPGQYREAWEAMEDMEEEEIRGKYAGVEQEYGIYDYSAEAVLEREIAGELDGGIAVYFCGTAADNICGEVNATQKETFYKVFFCANSEKAYGKLAY